MFSVRRTIPGGPGGASVEVAFTDASMDFSEGSGRDPARLDAELERLTATIGVPVQRMHQVHGATVVDVVSPVSSTSTVPRADALVTSLPAVALMTRAADCVPVLLADVSAGMVAAVHSGRAGLEADVVGATVRRMRSLGADQVHAWIGPHVCGACYEVPETMRDSVAERVPNAWAKTRRGTPALDLGAGVAAQLDDVGASHEVVGGCTLEDDTLWSYRRDPHGAGRHAGLVWVRA